MYIYFVYSVKRYVCCNTTDCCSTNVVCTVTLMFNLTLREK